jgi:hypothetical protein
MSLKSNATLVEQELPIPPEHLLSPPVFKGIVSPPIFRVLCVVNCHFSGLSVFFSLAIVLFLILLNDALQVTVE